MSRFTLNLSQPLCGGGGRYRAFTLFEVLVVVVIVMAMVLVAWPSLRTLWHSQHSDTLRNDLMAAISLARHRAVQERSEVVVCAALRRTCRSDNEWADGWLVFVDRNGNRSLDSTEPLVLVYAAQAGDHHISSNATPSTQLRFDALGNSRYQATFTFTTPDNAVSYLCLGGATRLRPSSQLCN